MTNKKYKKNFDYNLKTIYKILKKQPNFNEIWQEISEQIDYQELSVKSFGSNDLTEKTKDILFFELSDDEYKNCINNNFIINQFGVNDKINLQYYLFNNKINSCYKLIDEIDKQLIKENKNTINNFFTDLSLHDYLHDHFYFFNKIIEKKDDYIKVKFDNAQLLQIIKNSFLLNNFLNNKLKNINIEKTDNYLYEEIFLSKINYINTINNFILFLNNEIKLTKKEIFNIKKILTKNQLNSKSNYVEDNIATLFSLNNPLNYLEKLLIDNENGLKNFILFLKDNFDNNGDLIQNIFNDLLFKSTNKNPYQNNYTYSFNNEKEFIHNIKNNILSANKYKDIYLNLLNFVDNKESVINDSFLYVKNKYNEKSDLLFDYQWKIDLFNITKKVDIIEDLLTNYILFYFIEQNKSKFINLNIKEFSTNKLYDLKINNYFIDKNIELGDISNFKNIEEIVFNNISPIIFNKILDKKIDIVYSFLLNNKSIYDSHSINLSHFKDNMQNEIKAVFEKFIIDQKINNKNILNENIFKI